MEFIADLSCHSDEQGNPTAPFVFLQAEGPRNAELKTVREVDQLIGELEAMTANLYGWREQLAGQSATAHPTASFATG